MLIRLSILALAAACLMTAPAQAHRVHAGVTDIAINARTGEMEIIHRVYAHDLQAALGNGDEPEEFYASASGLAAVAAYVDGQFRLGEADGRLIETDYVGAELDGEFAWIYYVARPPADQAGFLVDNDILSDHFEDQVMMTNIRIDSHVRTAMQGPGRRAPVAVSFAAPAD